MTFSLQSSQTVLAGTNSLEQHKLCLFSKRFNGVLAVDQNFTIETELQLSSLSFWKPFSLTTNFFPGPGNSETLH